MAVKPTPCLLNPYLSSLMKASSDGIQGLLADIINLSSSSGTFLGDLKEAVVRPLFKKILEDPTNPVNYTPVLNLFFQDTVVERVVAEQLQAFLDDSSILDLFHSHLFLNYGMEMALFACLPYR